MAVHLNTLSHSRLWVSYSKDLKAISPDIFRDLAFFVTGIDSGVPNIRLTQELPKLARLSRQIFCLIEDQGYIGTRFARTGTHAIGIALSPSETEAFSMTRIRELAQQGSDAALATFVLGVRSTSIMLYAIRQGIRHSKAPSSGRRSPIRGTPSPSLLNMSIRWGEIRRLSTRAPPS